MYLHMAHADHIFVNEALRCEKFAIFISLKHGKYDVRIFNIKITCLNFIS